jgi:hypothetical protein
MPSKKNKPGTWTVGTRLNKGQDKLTGLATAKTIATLFCDGLPVHSLEGPTAEQSLRDFATRCNAVGMPAPKKVPRTIADGWRQSRHSHKV